jgi:hypothetical protein
LLGRIDERRFDGNTTDRPSDWLVPLPGFERLSDKALETLMRLTVTEAALGWVVIPPYGYRL